MAASDSPMASVTALPLFDRDAPKVAGLIAVIRRLTIARSTPEIMEIVTKAARNLLGADGVSFVLRDGQHCHYAEEDATSPLWKGQRFPSSACISGWCMEHGEAVAIPDVYQDDRVPHDAYRPTFVRSLIMTPVRQEQPIAAIAAYWERVRQFSAEEVELLQTVANAAALAVALVRAMEEREAARAHGGPFSLRGAGAALRQASHGLVFRLALARNAFRLATRSGLGAAVRWGPVRAWLARRPIAQWHRVLNGLLFTGLAWAARASMSPVMGDESPYAFFVPAVLVAAMRGGRTAGVTAMLAGGLVANVTFVGDAGAIDIEGGHLWALMSFWASSVFIIIVGDGMSRALRREAVANDHLEVIRGELQHRIKNIVTVAQALARQTARTTQGVREFEAALAERLEALAEAQVLLLEDQVRGAELGTLVSRILAPFGVDGRLEVSGGPEMRIDEQLAVGLALLLNELATNATKYGALSGNEGRVRVWWTYENHAVCLRWVERDGPPVGRPTKTGFGSRLLQSALPPARGVVRTHYEPEGVSCEVEFVVS